MAIQYIVVSIVLGIIIAFLITGSKKAALTSVYSQQSASDYVKNQRITGKNEVFLHKEVQRIPKPKVEGRDQGSSGGFQGGSIGGSMGRPVGRPMGRPMGGHHGGPGGPHGRH